MRFTTKVTSFIAAGGAVALGIGLMAFSPGVGAAFTDNATGSAAIGVGTFGCALSSTDPDVTISSDLHSATVNLGLITSSAAGSKTAPLTVKNAGTSPVVTSWSAAIDSGNLNHPPFAPVPAAGTVLNTSETQTVNIGFQWTALTNADLNRSGTVKYTVTCGEPGFTLFAQDGGTSALAGSVVKLTSPAATGGAGAGLTVTAPGTALPTAAPTFTTDAYRVGTPRYGLKLSNGSYAFGYPAQNGSAWEIPGQPQVTTYAGVTNYASTNNLTVADAFIVMDTSGGAQTANISCVQYNENYLLGSGC